MKRVLVENIEDGMILAKEVRGPSGSVLLNQGGALNAALGRRLKNWGVLFVHVEGEESSDGESDVIRVPPEEITSRLEAKFSLVMHKPLMKKLFYAFLNYQIKKGGGA